MINVVCLKWGDKYDSGYVNKLFRGVSRNLTLPFTFSCFTESAEGIDSGVQIFDLPYPELSSWWHKLYLFSKDLPIEGRIFFVDLDTLITGNIDEIASVDTGFVVLRDFFYGIARGVDKRSMGSGLMSWTAGEHCEIWDTFIRNPQRAIRQLHPHGDQRWVQRVQQRRVYWQDLFPGQVVSFKVHCNQGLAEDARIVCYHGKPSIPESMTQETIVPHFKIEPQAWVADHWK